MAKTKKTCHDCWQYHDYCKTCNRGRCYWHLNQPSPEYAADCEAYNPRTESRKHRDTNAELMPLLKQFYDFLQGISTPEGFVLAHPPHLTAEEAFTVIYMLQEHLGVIPDCFEACKECGGLYNSECEGDTIDDDSTRDGKPVPEQEWGHVCENCGEGIVID